MEWSALDPYGQLILKCIGSQCHGRTCNFRCPLLDLGYLQCIMVGTDCFQMAWFRAVFYKSWDCYLGFENYTFFRQTASFFLKTAQFSKFVCGWGHIFMWKDTRWSLHLTAPSLIQQSQVVDTVVWPSVQPSFQVAFLYFNRWQEKTSKGSLLSCCQREHHLTWQGHLLEWATYAPPRFSF